MNHSMMEAKMEHGKCERCDGSGPFCSEILLSDVKVVCLVCCEKDGHDCKVQWQGVLDGKAEE